MAQIQMTNFGDTTLSAGISAVDTAITFPVAHSGRFPTLTAGDWFYAVLVDTLGNREIIKVTAHAAGVGSFTALRAQEGTTGLVFPVGSVLSLRVTAQTFVDVISGILATSTTFGFRNKLINGDFSVWQRGTSFTAAGYGPDRCSLGIGGTATIIKSGAPGSPSGNYYATSTTGAASSYVNPIQAIERNNVFPLRGKTVTFSSLVQVGGTYAGSIILRAWYSNATDALASVTTVIGSLTITPTVGAIKYSYTFTVPSDAIGLAVGLVNATAQASGAALAWGDWQLEEGSVATPFESRPYGLELALCQRHCRVLTLSANKVFGHGVSYNTTTGLIHIPFNVSMRAAPTVTSAGTFQLMSGNWTGSPTTSIGDNGISTESSLLSVSTSGTYVVGQVCTLLANVGSSITFNAEL